MDVEFTSIQKYLDEDLHPSPPELKGRLSQFMDLNTEEIKNIFNLSIASIQFSTPENSYFIDFLSSELPTKDIITHLKPVLESENSLKLFHSCDNDIKLITSILGIYPRSIFDTEQFWRIKTDSSKSVSLKTLVLNILDVEMDKSFQVASWRVRPLNKAMIDYGLSDSYLLLVLFHFMVKKCLEGKSE